VLNGLITWLPTLYRQTFNLPLDTSIMYGFLTSAVAVAASLLCALYIDRVGRKRWYTAAFWLALVPLLALAYLGTVSAIELLVLATCAYAILQTIAFSLYLYSAELYPTRLRAVGTGLGSAWLRVGSAIGPITVGWLLGGYGVGGVFVAFSVMAAAGGVICIFFAIETRGRVLEELSP
jgi:putative MFS transporter